jgi:hypothetical protein
MMTFEEAVEQLAKEDGVSAMFTIPGIWECLSENYNNAAIALMESEDDTEEEDSHWCPDDDEAPCTPDCLWPLEEED